MILYAVREGQRVLHSRPSCLSTFPCKDFNVRQQKRCHPSETSHLAPRAPHYHFDVKGRTYGSRDIAISAGTVCFSRMPYPATRPTPGKDAQSCASHLAVVIRIQAAPSRHRRDTSMERNRTHFCPRKNFKVYCRGTYRRLHHPVSGRTFPPGMRSSVAVP